MDEKKRGYIESRMDETLEGRKSWASSVEWVLQQIPISSLRDLTLGYAIGFLKALALGVVLLDPSHNPEEEEGDEKIIVAIIRRRLPDIVDKINRELNR